MVVGVGNQQPAPIPCLDDNNVLQGHWQIEETERLAAITGLEYRHLETPEKLSVDLMLPNFPNQDK